MQEFVTDALVLGIRSFSNKDRQVDLFTKDFGRIKARVKSGSKPTSKLSPHLDPLNKVVVRLFEKNRFTVTDVLTEKRFEDIRKDKDLFSMALNILFLLRSIFPQEMPDRRLWHYLIAGLEDKKLGIETFLEILGYNPKLAPCFNCSNKGNNKFFVPDQLFVCHRCSKRMPEELLIQTT